MTHYALYTLLTTASMAFATALLGIVVARTMDRSHKFLSFFIALGAGLLVGVALTEFLPQVFHSHPTPLHDAQIHSNEHSHSPAGFGILPAFLILLGVFFVIILEKKVAQTLELSTQNSALSTDKLPLHTELQNTTTAPADTGGTTLSATTQTPAHHHHHEHGHHHGHNHEFCVHSHSHTHEPHITLKTACLSVGCVTVCSFFDGLEISTAFHMGSQVGWLTSLGFLLHSISNGALAASLGLAGGLSKSRAIQVSIVIGALLFIGSVVGVVGISLFDFKSYVLPFSTGVMLYISFTHLIPLALKDRLGWAGFILGTLITFIIHSLHTH